MDTCNSMGNSTDTNRGILEHYLKSGCLYNNFVDLEIPCSWLHSVLLCRIQEEIRHIITVPTYTQNKMNVSFKLLRFFELKIIWKTPLKSSYLVLLGHLGGFQKGPKVKLSKSEVFEPDRYPGISGFSNHRDSIFLTSQIVQKSKETSKIERFYKWNRKLKQTGNLFFMKIGSLMKFQSLDFWSKIPGPRILNLSCLTITMITFDDPVFGRIHPSYGQNFDQICSTNNKICI